MIWGLKLTGIKKANKGCLQVKDPVGKFFFCQAVRLHSCTYLWARERNLNRRTEASLNTYFHKDHPDAPLSALGKGEGGGLRWQHWAGPVLILAGGRRETFCARTLITWLGHIAPALDQLAAVTITRWVRPFIMMRGFNLFYFPCPLKIMHLLKMRKGPPLLPVLFTSSKSFKPSKYI